MRDVDLQVATEGDARRMVSRARDLLPKYFSKFSRHDFTVPQLFACLIVKEQQRKGYRDVEALLRDAPHWCRDIGMRKVPDHNTLCRAFHALNLIRRTGKLLDRLAQWFAVARQLGSVVARWTPAATTRATAAATTSSVAGTTRRRHRHRHHENARPTRGEAARRGCVPSWASACARGRT
jgi:hypothetical protein